MKIKVKMASKVNVYGVAVKVYGVAVKVYGVKVKVHGVIFRGTVNGYGE